MGKIIVYLFPILLLSTVIAKVSYTSSSDSYSFTFQKNLESDKNEKIDTEEEKKSTQDQLKNSEFIYIYNSHRFSVVSSKFSFTYLLATIPVSDLEMPERPPQKEVI